jgi:hypothetical protein
LRAQNRAEEALTARSGAPEPKNRRSQKPV